MKKFFFFAAAMLLSMSSFAVNYNVPTEAWTVGDLATMDAYAWYSKTANKYAVIGNDWYVFSAYDLYKSTPEKMKWISYTGSGNTSYVQPAYGIFKGGAFYDPDSKATTARTDRAYSYRVTNMAAVSVYGKAKNENSHLMVEVYENGAQEFAAHDSIVALKDTIVTLRDLDVTKEYIVVVYGNTSDNCNLYEIAFSISGEDPDLDPKAVAPVFSVKGGQYFDPFKVGLESSNADHIYVSVNNGIYEEYADSILIDQYDVDYTLSAYATLADAANSDTVSVSYRLKHFVARPVFNARKEYLFANVAAEEINILSPATATLGTYVLDGKDVPSISYTHLIHEDRDSFMIVSVKDRENVTFRYKNGQNKKDIMKFGENYIQCDGSNYEIWVDSVKSGDTIVFVVTAKGSAPKFDVQYSTASYLNPYMPEDDTDPCFTDGLVMTASDAKIENNYSGWTDLVYIVEEGGHSRVRIKETANGYRIAKILVGAYRGDAPVEGIENNAVDTKAVKFFRNGQLIIRKNGVEYNALGTKL